MCNPTLDGWNDNKGFVICSSIVPFGFASGVQIYPWYHWGSERDGDMPDIPAILGTDIHTIKSINHGYKGSWVGWELAGYEDVCNVSSGGTLMGGDGAHPGCKKRDIVRRGGKRSRHGHGAAIGGEEGGQELDEICKLGTGPSGIGEIRVTESGSKLAGGVGHDDVDRGESPRIKRLIDMIRKKRQRDNCVVRGCCGRMHPVHIVVSVWLRGRYTYIEVFGWG